MALCFACFDADVADEGDWCRRCLSEHHITTADQHAAVRRRKLRRVMQVERALGVAPLSDTEAVDVLCELNLQSPRAART